MSRDDLLEAIWNGRIVSAATLTHRINAARAAIGDNGHDQRLIRTVAQQGVRFIGAIKEQWTTATPTLAKPHRPSIAVLPFTNVSGDPEQDYFADGMKRALRLSPFDPINCFTYNALAIAYFRAQRYEEMLEASRHSQRCNPHFSIPHALMAAALVRLGRTFEANVEARRVLKLEPAFSIRSSSARIGLAPEMYISFANSWKEAGLPEDQALTNN